MLTDAEQNELESLRRSAPDKFWLSRLIELERKDAPSSWCRLTDRERNLIVHCLRSHAAADVDRIRQIREAKPPIPGADVLIGIFEAQSTESLKLADKIEGET